jgi:hypothetical protein
MSRGSLPDRSQSLPEVIAWQAIIREDLEVGIDRCQWFQDPSEHAWLAVNFH